MIARVKGSLVNKSTDSVIIDVGGVGYEVLIPLSTYYKLPELNEILALNVHTNVREDAIQLYGFLTVEEKEAFQLLIGISGIGPKLAKNILSGIGVDELYAAISNGDKARLSSIPGIGGKSAERLIVELRDKVKNLAKAASSKAGTQEQPKDTATADVVSALENLGYKNVMAEEAVKKAKALGAGNSFEGLFKEALKVLSKKA